MDKFIDDSKPFNSGMETCADNVKSPADRAFWKIDAMVGELFDEFVARDNLPTHDKHNRKITCRGFYPTRRGNYDKLYYESVGKAVELVKQSDILDFKVLVDEIGSEEKLIHELKFA